MGLIGALAAGARGMLLYEPSWSSPRELRMSLIETRGHQMFPVLEPVQIETVKRFASGPVREFPPAETVYKPGQQNVPMWLVLKGSIEVVRQDALNHEVPIIVLGAGQFSGDVGQLAGRGALALANAGPEGCTALPFDAAHVRALLIGSAEVGDIVMRAFILRRVALIEEGGVGSVLIGDPASREIVRLQGFLRRNGYPYTVLDANKDEGPWDCRAPRRASRRATCRSLPQWQHPEMSHGR
jgi:thioredoxin reductase (NADPH)